MTEVICTGCGRKLSQTEEHFLRREDTLIGWQARCKDCYNGRKRRWAHKHKDYIYGRFLRQKAKLQQTRPEVLIARHALSWAIRSGRLVRQPCVCCGNPKSEGHHPDYSRPLEVVWLCGPHHKAVHSTPASRESKCPRCGSHLRHITFPIGANLPYRSCDDAWHVAIGEPATKP